MSELARIVRRRRQELAWSLAQLASAAGCSKAYLSAIENDRLANPPSRKLLRSLEAALEIGDGELVRLAEWQATPENVKAQFVRLTEQIQLAQRRDDGAINLDAVIAALGPPPPDPTEAPPPEPSRMRSIDVGTLPGGVCFRVPLINKVAAGYPTDFTDLEYPARSADEHVYAPGVADSGAFAATVVGESMAPQYREGDVIIFSPGRDVADGDDCFVRLLPDHHTTFKRVFFEADGRVRLQPLNPAFAPVVVALEDVSGLWPAVYRMQRLNGGGV